MFWLKNANPRRKHTLWFNLYKFLKMKKIIDVENRRVFQGLRRDAGRREMIMTIKKQHQGSLRGWKFCLNYINVNILFVISYCSSREWMYDSLFIHWWKLNKAYTVCYSLQLYVILWLSQIKSFNFLEIIKTNPVGK